MASHHRLVVTESKTESESPTQQPQFQEFLSDARAKSASIVAHSRRLLGPAGANSIPKLRARNGDSNSGLRLLELFAGIGGMCCALELAGVKVTSTIAVDTSPLAAAAYAANHLSEEGCELTDRLWQRNVERLTAKTLDAVAADIWTMSPPCQPFTTTAGAKRLGAADQRCSALSHLTTVVGALQRPPMWILLENVKGFEGSTALAAWKQALRAAGYTWRCFLYDPIDFGVPNHRMRLFMLAERSERWAAHQEAGDATLWSHSAAARTVGAPSEALPSAGLIERAVVEAAATVAACGDNTATTAAAAGSGGEAGAVASGAAACELSASTDTAAEPSEGICSTASEACGASVVQVAPAMVMGGAPTPRQKLAAFLDPLDEATARERGLLLTRKQLQKRSAAGLSIITGADDVTFCFTSSYGRLLHKSSGSILLMGEGEPPVQGRAVPLDRSDMTVFEGRLRFFSPQELLRIFGFPATFRFPPFMTSRHQWKLVGQSINVVAVAEVARLIVEADENGLSSAIAAEQSKQG